jgi:hypothetical protein
VLDCGCSINPFQLPTNPIKTHFGALSNRLPVQIANDAPSNPTDAENLSDSQSIFVVMIQKSRSKSVQRTKVSSVVEVLVRQLVKPSDAFFTKESDLRIDDGIMISIKPVSQNTNLWICDNLDPDSNGTKERSALRKALLAQDFN